jgi:gustatory receptor
MAFKLLRLIFKVGRFTATTPTSIDTKEESVCQKIYISLVFAALTFGLVITIINNNYFQEDIHMKIAISYLTEFNLYSFSFYTMVVLNLWKREQWYDLIESLSVVKKKTKMWKIGKRKVPYYLGFVVNNIFYILTDSYDNYSWFTHYGWEFFKRFNVRLIQLFLQFFFKLLLFEILRIILANYKKLNQCLKNKNISLVHLRRVVKTVCLLQRTVDIFNDLFGLPFALLVSFTTFEVLNYILFALYYQGDISLTENIILATLRLHPSIVSSCVKPLDSLIHLCFQIWTVVLLIMCDSVSCEAKEILSTIDELRFSIDGINQKEEQELFMLTDYVKENLPVFTAAGYFTLAKPTILNMSATVANFLIVVVQVTNKI